MTYPTNDFARVCEDNKKFLDVFNSMKRQTDIIKTAIAEKTDREHDANIRDATLKLDQILTRTISSVRTQSKCNINDYNKQFSTLATAVKINKTMNSVEEAKSGCKKEIPNLATAEIQRKVSESLYIELHKR